LPHELGRRLKLVERALEIDDVNLVAVPENEGRHFRIPEARLVSKVDTGFQHLTHRYRHQRSPRLDPARTSRRTGLFGSGPHLGDAVRDFSRISIKSADLKSNDFR
jgi:hypothetical protein